MTIERSVNAADIEEAGLMIIKSVQAESFSEELKVLQRANCQEEGNVKMRSSLSKLDSFIDSKGISMRKQSMRAKESPSMRYNLTDFGSLVELRLSTQRFHLGSLVVSYAEQPLSRRCPAFLKIISNVACLSRIVVLTTDDEFLRTLMCEAESIVNSQPFTVNQLTDPDSPEPLTPNHLLTMKSKVLLPPRGVFIEADIYCNRRWRRVQHLANGFWTQWRKEFLLILQERQKWVRPEHNLCVGDIVMVKEENLARNQWELSRISSVYPSADGRIRKVQVAVADKTLDKKGGRINPVHFYVRPVEKMVLLVPCGESALG
eukprot:gene12609-13897_t